MAMVLTCQKPTQRGREGEVPEGLPGSTKSAVCVERSVENLGDPRGSWGPPQVGGSARSAEGLSDVRSTGSTRRTGEPSTGGSGGQRFAACTGNRRRARRTGETPANLPAGDSGQGAARAGYAPRRRLLRLDAEARTSEEPGALCGVRSYVAYLSQGILRSGLPPLVDAT